VLTKYLRGTHLRVPLLIDPLAVVQPSRGTKSTILTGHWVQQDTHANSRALAVNANGSLSVGLTKWMGDANDLFLPRRTLGSSSESLPPTSRSAMLDTEKLSEISKRWRIVTAALAIEGSTLGGCLEWNNQNWLMTWKPKAKHR
jgi:hypothetical protein